MRERMQTIGGVLQVRSAAWQGTTVVAITERLRNRQAKHLRGLVNRAA